MADAFIADACAGSITAPPAKGPFVCLGKFYTTQQNGTRTNNTAVFLLSSIQKKDGINRRGLGFLTLLCPLKTKTVNVYIFLFLKQDLISVT